MLVSLHAAGQGVVREVGEVGRPDERPVPGRCPADVRMAASLWRFKLLFGVKGAALAGLIRASCSCFVLAPFQR